MKLDEFTCVTRNNDNFLLTSPHHHQQQQQHRHLQQFYSENRAVASSQLPTNNPNLYSYIPRKTLPTTPAQLLYHSFTEAPQSYTMSSNHIEDDEQVLIKINPLARELRGSSSSNGGLSSNNQYHGITSEETRRLSGLVAKTRALFESSNTGSTSSSGTSRCSINKSVSAYSLNKNTKSVNNKENYSSNPVYQPPPPSNTLCDRYVPLSSSFHSNLSSLSYKQFKSAMTESTGSQSSNSSSERLLPWSKTDESVKELNLPRSVKEARMAFESLASNKSSSSSSCSSSMSFSNGRINTGGSYSKLAQSSTHVYTTDNRVSEKCNRKAYYDSPQQASSSSSTNLKPTGSSTSSNHLIHSQIVKPRSSYRNNLIVDMTGTATASPLPQAAIGSQVDSSSLSSNNSVDLNSNSPTESQSSCNTTPRSNHKTTESAPPTTTVGLQPGSILNHIKRDDLATTTVSHPSTSKLFGSSSLSSSASSTSSISCSSYTENKQPPSRFNKLFNSAGKVNQASNYRKLEDIMTEADNLTLNSILINEQRYTGNSSNQAVAVSDGVDDKKVVKSILRKFSPPVASTVSAETIDKSSSYSSATTTDNLVDKSSCVLPSKIKTTVVASNFNSQQSTTPTVNKTNNYSRFNGNVNDSLNATNQHNYRPWSSSNTTTPVRSSGTFIKNSQSSATTTTSSGGVVKRATRNAAAAREALIRWCSKVTEGYNHVNITNFSSSWADGMAFCALVHRFMPNEFDYAKLSPANREYNFTLAFTLAEEKAGVLSLLDVEDMIEMGNSPDWKCVFTYVHTLYQRFKEEY